MRNRSNGKEERSVALKELTLELHQMDDKSAQDFLVEIRLMHALRNEHVVRFEGIALHEDRLYLVTVSPTCQKILYLFLLLTSRNRN